jgi:dihydroorotase-like cyclic amidohydrolase
LLFNIIGNVLFCIIVDFVIPSKEQSLLEAYKQWRERADSKVCCDYGLHVAITHWDEQVAKDMETLTKEKGLTIKIYVQDVLKKMDTA